MLFCDCCSYIFNNHIFDVLHNTPISHHKSITSFVAAADGYCIICRKAFRSLPPETQETLRYYGRTLAAVYEDPSVGTLLEKKPSGTAVLPGFTEFHVKMTKWASPGRISLSIHLNAAHRVEMMSERDIIDADADFSSRIIDKLQKPTAGILNVTFNKVRGKGYHLQSRIPSATNTGSSETWDLVKAWLKECTIKHRACNKAKPTWYPSRLLDLGRSGSSKTDVCPRFSIVKGREVSPGERYITLSHRWGVSHTPRITVQNLGAYEQGMPTSVLPTSFQDAITVAQRLGIRYIWIDSLCIIQDGDNGQDWRREAPLMEKVYANAFCNLAANWGSDLAGLFFERDTTLFGQIQQRLLFKDRFAVTHNLTYNLFSTGNHWIEEVLDAPLNKRGWVLQERILAPRILHFCRREVFWECCEKTASESFPAKLPPRELTIGDDRLSYAIRDLKRLIHTSTNSDEACRLYEIWHCVVELYTKCQLTKQSDKLVAIAGLARSLSPFLRDLYVAGVWSRNLVIDLAWYMVEPEPASRDSNLPYRAPSFSWASVNGHIRWQGERLDPAQDSLVQLLCIKARRFQDRMMTDSTADVELLVEDIFGPCNLPAVELQVTGGLHAAVMRRSRQNDRGGASESMSSHAALSIGVTNLRTLIETKAISIALDNVPSAAESEDKTFYYIPWIASPRIGLREGMHPPLVLIALMLELIDPELGQFRRIGIIKAHRPTLDTRAVLLGSRIDGPLHPSWSFHEESGLHTVYII